MTPQTPGAPLTGRVPNNHHHSRTHTATTGTATLTPTDGEDEVELFVDPMMGSPLQIFVEKEVPNIELITSLVKKHGGVIGPNYSTVQYILVASNKESGQNLYRQYHNKKGKIVLDARWVLECVKAGELLTFKKNWGGCRVTGEETVIPDPARGAPLAAVQDPIAGPSIPAQGNTSAAPSTFTTQLTPQVNRAKKTRNEPQQLRQHQQQQQQEHDLAQVTQQQPQPFPAFPPPTGTAAPHHLTNAPPPPAPGFPSWNTMQASHPQLPPRHPLHQHPHPQQNHPAAQQVTHLSQVHHRLPQPPQTHLMHPFTVPALAAQARGSWYGVVAGPSPVAGHPAADVGQTGHGGAQGGHPPHAFAHFPDATTWEHHGAPEGVYYQPHFGAFQEAQFAMPEPAVQEPITGAEPEQMPEGPAPTENAAETDDESRGRKRKRTGPPTPSGSKKSRYVAPPPTNPADLVPALKPRRRSPTPPTRVVKSTYGGNLFTTEDITYLKKYIDWCVDMGEVLSLREICERLAIKAAHHTFYSWRRYCNKHKIKLGSYQMANPETDRRDGGDSDPEDDREIEEEVVPNPPQGAPTTNIVPAPRDRNRSPTPPRSLHRSTTGKGIAFTEEDVTFLVRYLNYRREREPNLNMPQFWNDLATKAPHHSRASWLKYWRRHRHEIEVNGGDDEEGGPGISSVPLQVPQPGGNVAKRQRYSQADDVLLAKFWATNPQGTSDKLFQAFAKQHPHHPWKGWQEHHRIHKAQIDHLIRLLLQGVDIDALPAPPAVKAGRQASVREG